MSLAISRSRRFCWVGEIWWNIQIDIAGVIFRDLVGEIFRSLADEIW